MSWHCKYYYHQYTIHPLLIQGGGRGWSLWIFAISFLSLINFQNNAFPQDNYNAERSNITSDEGRTVITDGASAQKTAKTKAAYDPLHPPNTYRNPDNPNYWKNRPPYEGYWQQDVYYSISANIDEKTDIVSGREKLTYWNNSPDTLKELFFHLYQNAFQPGSYLDKLQMTDDFKASYGKYESKGLNTVVEKITVNGKQVKTELDNTILKVWLPKPLKSGDSLNADIVFKSYFDSGGVRRRMKMFYSGSFKHYDGVHWYPRVAVYDRKFGWETDQHLGHEFYGDFGAYDVELTFANNYVVEATGELQNRKEVLPDTLRKKLDISNFKDKELDSPPSVIIPYDSTKRKTWKYHAENVHDFAFTADPTYRINETLIKLREPGGGDHEVMCIGLAQEMHAAKWQNASEYVSKIVKVYSQDIGMFVWHKMIAADARDGMEYPMLTLDGGLDPDYRGLFAHEIGHNWFYGQVGNNETYRAALDEGFTQFLTSWCYERLEGQKLIKKEPRNFYAKNFKRPEYIRDNRTYFPYINDALQSSDVTLNTHSDDFENGGGYRQVYYKTATMLYNLQYVLGDELFLKAMRHYFEQWKICHPYFEDFRNSIIRYTHTDLNWFFDEWLETSKVIDYKVASVKKVKNDTLNKQLAPSKRQNAYEITFKRKGTMQMPLDVRIDTKDGHSYSYIIPNTWFAKKSDAVILPKWLGWGKLNTTYKTKVEVPGKIYNVSIDPSLRMADIYIPDNAKRHRVKYYFDSRVFNPPDRKNYEVFLRPDIWYNAYDGIKAGFHAEGNYMDFKNIFSLTAWFNTGNFQQLDSLSENFSDKFNPFSFSFRYRTPTYKFSKYSNIYLSARYLDGLNAYSAGFDKWDKPHRNKLNLWAKSMFRLQKSDLHYLLEPGLWNAGKLNNTVNISFEHIYTYKRGRGDIVLKISSAAPGSDYDQAQFIMTVKNDNNLGKINIRTRTFLQYGTGRNPAPESRLYFAGASPEELMENKFTRAAGIFPEEWLGYGYKTNHFQYGGGLNMRGFAGYVVPVDAKGGQRWRYAGDAGAAFNAEMDFTQLIPIRFKPHYNGWYPRTPLFGYNTYLFGDAGIINYNYSYESPAFSNLRMDAGAGFAFTINRWGPVEDVAPLTIRFDIPAYLYPVPAAETAEPLNPNYKLKWNDVIQFRWVVSIGRAF